MGKCRTAKFEAQFCAFKIMLNCCTGFERADFLESTVQLVVVPQHDILSNAKTAEKTMPVLLNVCRKRSRCGSTTPMLGHKLRLPVVRDAGERAWQERSVVKILVASCFWG